MEFLEPLWLLKRLNIFLIVVAYAVTHNFVLTLLAVEIGALLIPRFHLNPQQTGLNYIGFFVG
jgi:hypothetical protein